MSTVPPMPRLIFLVHGGVTVADRALSDGEAWQGEGAATLAAGAAGATGPSAGTATADSIDAAVGRSSCGAGRRVDVLQALWLE